MRFFVKMYLAGLFVLIGVNFYLGLTMHYWYSWAGVIVGAVGAICLIAVLREVKK